MNTTTLLRSISFVAIIMVAAPAASSQPPARVATKGDCANNTGNGKASLQARVHQLQAIVPAWGNNTNDINDNRGTHAIYSSRTARGAVCAAEMENFDRVAPNVYRGGQPSLDVSSKEEDDATLLSRIGVTDIVDLREPSTNRTRRERQRSAEEQITYHAVPLPSRAFGFPFPGSKKFAIYRMDIARAVALIKQLEGKNSVVYVHCAHGADRTGVVMAMRSLLDGTSLAVAMAEAEDHSFSAFQRGMRDFVKQHAAADKLAEFRHLVDAYYNSVLISK